MERPTEGYTWINIWRDTKIDIQGKTNGVTCTEGIQGWTYIERHKEGHARRDIQGVTNGVKYREERIELHI